MAYYRLVWGLKFNHKPNLLPTFKLGNTKQNSVTKYGGLGVSSHGILLNSTNRLSDLSARKFTNSVFPQNFPGTRSFRYPTSVRTFNLMGSLPLPL